MIFTLDAPIAQLDRVSDYESEGLRFESSWARNYFMKDLFSRLTSCILIGAGGLTGNWYARFLLKNGVVVYAFDSNPGASYPDDLLKSPLFIPVDEKKVRDLIYYKEAQAVTLSPGVPLSLEVFSMARERGLSVFSEFQYGWHFFQKLGKRSMGVTGTDGKSTTVHFIASVLQSFGLPALAAGNFGIPLSQILTEWDGFRKYEVFVFEFSSYQLEMFEGVSVNTAVYLNLAPDHLNRYRDIADYGMAKWNLGLQMKEGSFFYGDVLKKYHSLWSKDPAEGISKEVEKTEINTLDLKGRHFTFKVDSDRKLKEILFSPGNDPSAGNTGFHYALPKGLLKIEGRHNYLNLLFALEAAYSILSESEKKRVNASGFDDVIDTLSALPHRFEVFLRKNGNVYINDSKATTTQAVGTALANVAGNVFLFMGGKGKGEDYSVLVPALKEKDTTLFLYGEERARMNQIFEKAGLRIEAINETLEEVFHAAVRFQKTEALSDVTYLLSPGVTSWDQYKSFEARGDHFKNLVNNG